MSNQPRVSSWSILFLCIAAVIVVGMITGYDVDVGGNDGCVSVQKKSPVEKAPQAEKTPP